MTRFLAPRLNGLRYFCADAWDEWRHSPAVNLLALATLTSALFLVPSVLLGLFLGSRLHAAVPGALVVRVVYVVVAIAGASLLVRVFAG